MGKLEFGFGNESKLDSTASQVELRMRWEVSEAVTQFKRLFNANLLSYVGRVVRIFSPPQSVGFLFEFGPGGYDAFSELVRNSTAVTPDDPGVGAVDGWWREAAAGAAIGASFRERGKDTSVHISFNKTLCDVHVDRNGFVVSEGGHEHWDVNGLLRHLTFDLAGDKAPWLLPSVTYLDKHNHPAFNATLGPWIAVDLPSKDAVNSPGITIGIGIVGNWGR